LDDPAVAFVRAQDFMDAPGRHGPSMLAPDDEMIPRTTTPEKDFHITGLTGIG
jgi:hypothetical protein